MKAVKASYAHTSEKNLKFEHEKQIKVKTLHALQSAERYSFYGS